MTDAEMQAAYLSNKRVYVTTHDYEFVGYIVSVFKKRDRKTIRCVVESDDRICLIQSAKSLQLMEHHDAVPA